MSQLMCGVFYANKNTRGKAAFFITYDTARDLVNAFMATWNKKANAINLKHSQAEMSPTAQSLKMGPAVIQKAAEGSAYHVALVEGWGTRLS